MDYSKEANVENDVVEHHEAMSNIDEVIEQSDGRLLLDIGYQKGDSRRTDLKTTKDGHVRVSHASMMIRRLTTSPRPFSFRSRPTTRTIP